MQRRLALTTGLAAATLLTLLGCSAGTGGTGGAGTGDGTGDGTTGGELAGGGATADCMIGDWDLDELAVARALGEQMESSGAEVIATDASGAVGLTVTPDRMAWTSDVTYSVTVQVDAELTLQTLQLQSGFASGGWALESDDWATFSGWESDIVVTTTSVVNGVETAPTTTDIPESSDGVPLLVTCDGALMSTQPEGSPIMSVWTRR